MADKLVTINTTGVDILEDDIRNLSPTLLNILLYDHSTQKNIIWATNDYQALGEDYGYHKEIKSGLITEEHGHVIMPRVNKAKHVQTQRKKDKAEIFTPSWICNAQVNLIDGAWFGRDGVFNTEHDDHTWETNSEPITFPEGKTWKDYVRDNRLEITCGEGPYMTSRYDAVTGELIPLRDRIGMVDRKLRVVTENTVTPRQWIYWAKEALRATYGYEWQGDSLLLARENLFATFIDNYEYHFHTSPSIKTLLGVARIISWNIWQMDGLKGVVPGTCKSSLLTTYNLDGTKTEQIILCPGCKHKQSLNDLHNGTHCRVADWSAGHRRGGEPSKTLRFIDIHP